MHDLRRARTVRGPHAASVATQACLLGGETGRAATLAVPTLSLRPLA